MKKNYKASQTFNAILRLILGFFLKIKFRLEAHNDEIRNLKGPYIILGNHVNNWDPFMISIFVKKPIHFVAGEGTFKNPLLRWALTHLVGAIPKTKFMPDSTTIRQIVRVKNSGGVIGIFPEGQRNWHGVTGELMYSTAKLIKSLKLPVVTVILKGAYLSHPRWAENSRKGKVELHYHLALTPDKIKVMSEEEIFSSIVEKLYHAESQWQNENNIAFKGSNAERLELFLFACPDCGTFESLASKGTEYLCSKCGYSVEYNEYGAIKSKSGNLHFDNLFMWDKWQLEHLRDKIDRLSNDHALFNHSYVTIYEGKKMRSFSSRVSGSLALYKDKLILKTNDWNEKSFNIHAMHGVNVNMNKRIEFFYNKSMYRIVFINRLVSAYMWVSAIEYLQRPEKNILVDSGISSKTN